MTLNTKQKMLFEQITMYALEDAIKKLNLKNVSAYTCTATDSFTQCYAKLECTQNLPLGTIETIGALPLNNLRYFWELFRLSQYDPQIEKLRNVLVEITISIFKEQFGGCYIRGITSYQLPRKGSKY